MDDDKLQRLHDTLAKLAPRGKVGGLGFNSFTKQVKSKDPTLPDTPLFNYFVRAGSGQGLYHKRDFGEEPEGNATAEAEANPSLSEDDKKKKKKKKKKRSKEKEPEPVIEPEPEELVEEEKKSKKSKRTKETGDKDAVETKEKKKKKKKESKQEIDECEPDVEEMSVTLIEEEMPVVIKKRKRSNSDMEIVEQGRLESKEKKDKDRKAKKAKKEKK